MKVLRSSRRCCEPLKGVANLAKVHCSRALCSQEVHERCELHECVANLVMVSQTSNLITIVSQAVGQQFASVLEYLNGWRTSSCSVCVCAKVEIHANHYLLVVSIISHPETAMVLSDYAKQRILERTESL